MRWVLSLTDVDVSGDALAAYESEVAEVVLTVLDSVETVYSDVAFVFDATVVNSEEE